MPIDQDKIWETLKNLDKMQGQDVIINSLIFSIFLVVFLWTSRAQAKKQQKILEELALRHNGSVKKGRFFSFPRLVLFSGVGEVQIYSTQGAKNSPSMTFFSTELHSAGGFECDIARPNPLQLTGLMFQRKLIKLNSPAFDQYFMIQTNDPPAAAHFMTLEIQSKLLGLKEWSPRLRIRGNKLVFSIARLYEQERQYDEFIDAGTTFVKKAHEVG